MYLSRRAVGYYQNEVQRSALGLYQNQGRRIDRRGGYRPFTLPGDVLRRARLTPEYSLANVLVPYGTPGSRRRMLSGYGGFGERPQGSLGTAKSAYQRRYALIGSAALNAPVHRAMERGGRSQRLGSIIVPTTAPSRTQEDISYLDTRAAGATLAQQLDARAHRAGTIARREAWRWFGEGQYMQAARAFERATAVDPSDNEGRIGELFCYLSLGRPLTAVAVLRQVVRRDGAVFLPQLDLAGTYADPSRARQVRTQVSLLAAQSTTNPDVRALYVVALWYLDEAQEALRVGAALARDFPHSAYADWPAQIRAVQSRRPKSED